MVNAGRIPFPPYAASAGWYAAWLSAFLSGEAEPEKEANHSLLVKGRDFARTKIRRSGGTGILSVPIVGGGHSLSREAGVLNAGLSDHGEWRRIHLGALEAAYGRTPFYPHLAPAIRESVMSELTTLAEFNLALHGVLSAFILSGLQLPGGVRYARKVTLTGNALERAVEVALMINPELSVIDALMRFGPEAVLGLLKL